MKTTDLRIFNLIQRYNDKTKTYDILTVYEINEEELNGLKSNLREGEGIPLTEDWLLRLGFEKEWDNDGSGDYDYIKEIGRYYFVVRSTNDYQILHRRDIGIPYEIIKDSCKYVHQLQNLYHDITGNELTIKTQTL